MKNLYQQMKKAWAAYLRTLTKANRESFGSGQPDCCAPRNRGPTLKKGG